MKRQIFWTFVSRSAFLHQPDAYGNLSFGVNRFDLLKSLNQEVFDFKFIDNYSCINGIEGVITPNAPDTATYRLHSAQYFAVLPKCMKRPKPHANYYQSTVIYAQISCMALLHFWWSIIALLLFHTLSLFRQCTRFWPIICSYLNTEHTQSCWWNDINWKATIHTGK